MDDASVTPDTLALPGRPAQVRDPEPPYQDRGGTQIYLQGRIPPAAARSILPPGLVATAANTAFLAIGTTPEGWGLAPFNGFCAGVEIEGFDNSDGSPGAFLFAGAYTGMAGRILPRDFNSRLSAGDVRFDHDATGARCSVAMSGGEGHLRASARPDSGPAVPVSGTANYLGIDRMGRLTLQVQGYSFNSRDAGDVDLQIHLPPGHPLEFLRAFKVETALYFTEKSISFMAPRLLDQTEAEQPAIQSVLDLLGRLGRALAIVESGGRILFMTAEAKAILDAEGAATLRRALPDLGEVSPQPATGTTALLSLSTGDQVLATAYPIALRLSDAPAAMVVLSDPRRTGPTDPVPMLRLLGLTPSEAALAAMIGSGRILAEAAMQRGISESTARSTLKVIFSKLGLRRQAELAQMVTRLQMG